MKEDEPGSLQQGIPLIFGVVLVVNIITIHEHLMLVMWNTIKNT